jgi:ankyrin repeat protein
MTKAVIAAWVLALVPLTGSLLAADSRMADAAKNQDRDTVKALLKQHVDVRAAEDDGATALHWAAHWDDLEMADLLIRAGANASAATDLGVTPLSLACNNGGDAMVSKLLLAGANANIATSTGETPLMTCARAGNAEAVKALLAHGAKVNAKENLRDQTALMWAVSQRHAEVVSVLLANGADVKARSRVTGQLVVRNIVGSRFVCPSGASGEDPTKTGYKIENGTQPAVKATCAKADMAPKGGSTPLMFAARVGALDSAKLLVAAGANVNDAGPDGNSVLVIAAHSGQGKVAELLLDKDANPNASGAGYTALHAAVLTGDTELVKALLAHGANPNLRLTKGTPVLRDNVELHLSEALLGATPFFLAAKFLEIDSMRSLAAAGADTQLALNDGTTPLMAATGVEWMEASPTKKRYTRREAMTPNSAGMPFPDDDEALATVKLALELAHNVNAANKAGDTAMHGAANCGYAAIIQLLAEQGANLNAQNKKGATPLDLADGYLRGNKGPHEPNKAEIMLRKLGAQGHGSQPATAPPAVTP